MLRREFVRLMGGTVAAGALSTRALQAWPRLEDVLRAEGARPDSAHFWRLVRGQFLLDRDVAYLNTGGLGASPLPVIRRLKELIDAEECHPSAGHDEPDWWRFKEKFAPWFGPGILPQELALTGTATEGINIVLNGLPWTAGDEVITSTHEHPAVNVPLLLKRLRQGIVIRTFEPDVERGSGNTERIAALITPRTRLIIISHVTCTLGQQFPVAEIGALARARNILFALDGVQAIGQVPLDLKSAGVDFYAVSGHKWMHGTKRTGILYVREDRLDLLQPTVVGAYSSTRYDMATQTLTLHPTAQRYEFATQNEALFYGLAAAVEFIDTIGRDVINAHNRRLSEAFHEALGDIGGVKILSPREPEWRTHMITFRLSGRDNEAVYDELVRRKLRVRKVNEHALDAIRVSFALYNDERELDRLLTEIRDLARS